VSGPAEKTGAIAGRQQSGCCAERYATMMIAQNPFRRHRFFLQSGNSVARPAHRNFLLHLCHHEAEIGRIIFLREGNSGNRPHRLNASATERLPTVN
jgi:hypothetical protein